MSARTIDELTALRGADAPGRIDAMARVLRALYGRPRPLSLVGRHLGVTGGRVRQIERRALRHLAEGLLCKMPA